MADDHAIQMRDTKMPEGRNDRGTAEIESTRIRSACIEHHDVVACLYDTGESLPDIKLQQANSPGPVKCCWGAASESSTAVRPAFRGAACRQETGPLRQSPTTHRAALGLPGTTPTSLGRPATPERAGLAHEKLSKRQRLSAMTLCPSCQQSSAPRPKGTTRVPMIGTAIRLARGATKMPSEIHRGATAAFRQTDTAALSAVVSPACPSRQIARGWESSTSDWQLRQTTATGWRKWREGIDQQQQSQHTQQHRERSGSPSQDHCHGNQDDHRQGPAGRQGETCEQCVNKRSSDPANDSDCLSCHLRRTERDQARQLTGKPSPIIETRPMWVPKSRPDGWFRYPGERATLAPSNCRESRQSAHR